MPSFVEIGPLVPEKKIFEGFLPYMRMAAILVVYPGLFIIYIIYIGSHFLQMLGLVNKHLRKNKTQIFQAKWQKLQFSAFRLISQSRSQWKL